MVKNEFIEILRQSLYGEVSSEVIEKNIQFYEEYISSQKCKEEDTIVKLGDPRLIARSIIESERAARQKDRIYSRQDNRNEQSYHYGKDDTKTDHGGNQQANSNKRIRFSSNLTWIQKISALLLLLILLFFIIFIGRIIIGVLFTLAVPILLIIILFALFKRRQ